ncbi:MAG: helix-turn-helix transcriptional regulator [Clostridiales bacterium]|nr:helix-turn-helix transcriptional regulator [Clostridiales bacterium]
MANLLSDRIAELRKERGLTQEQLGQLVGVSAQAVSKWEKGGAPDVELLPTLADRLGVTIDSLFGREGGARENIQDTVNRWLLSLPPEKRLDQLCRLVWKASMVSAVQHIDNFPLLDGGYMESCITHARDTDILIRLAVDTMEGLTFGVGGEDMSFMSLWPRPEAGHAAWFAPRDLCCRLFALLARPGCLEMLERLHDDLNARYYVPEVLAKQLSRPPEEVAQLLEAMAELRLVKNLDLELETGPVNAYIVHENWAFMPLMLFTRCLLEEYDAFYVAWDDHEILPGTRSDVPHSLYGRLTIKQDPSADRPLMKGESR